MKALAGKGKEEAQALLEGLIKEDVLLIPGFAFDATGGKAEPVRVIGIGVACMRIGSRDERWEQIDLHPLPLYHPTNTSEPRRQHNTQAFRATFATASPEKIEEGIARFARALAGLTSAPTAV